MDETHKQEIEELSPEELEAQGGEELPDREAMSLINANVAALCLELFGRQLFDLLLVSLIHGRSFRFVSRA